MFLSGNAVLMAFYNCISSAMYNSCFADHLNLVKDVDFNTNAYLGKYPLEFWNS